MQVVGTLWQCLIEQLPMSADINCFYREIGIILPFNVEKSIPSRAMNVCISKQEL